jgi:predicted transcriptional regulator of viral defense system
MKSTELKNIKKFYFGYEDISRSLGISAASAKVAASRYVKQGILLRMKKNMYLLKEEWKVAGLEDKFLLANMGQVPSYISLTTALEYYEITTQVQWNFFESLAVKRSKEINLEGSVFRYAKVKESLYFGFKKEKGFFIATPEKAFMDAVYLMSYGRYGLDISAIDETKFDRKEVERLSREYPLRTTKMLRKYGYI